MKKHKITALLGILVALGTLSLTTGCNTTEGFGRDVESAGEGIQDAAN